MLQLLRKRIGSLQRDLGLPVGARKERRRDRQGLPDADPGIDRVIDEGVKWLGRAQDQSTSHDGGVSRAYSLINGWATSYPETTGYIVPTLMEYGRAQGDTKTRDRAMRMLDWLVSIQLPCGGFQGGRVDSVPVVPVTFNTGQILLGLAAGTRELDTYRESMCRAATWLVDTQDADGCWRNFPTPFAKIGTKAYETHVAWGLLEAARVEPDSGWAAAAHANARWSLTNQRENGWVENCCLNEPSRPLTHALGYFLRGLIEAYRYFEAPELLAGARKTADGLLKCLDRDGYLPGRILPDWKPAVRWVCLTGSVQVAHCWLMLYEYTRDERYRDAGFNANRFVRRTVRIKGDPDVRGAVKGAFPIDGDYGRYEYLNWAVKFCIDSNALERKIRSKQPAM